MAAECALYYVRFWLSPSGLIFLKVETSEHLIQRPSFFSLLGKSPARSIVFADPLSLSSKDFGGPRTTIRFRTRFRCPCRQFSLAQSWSVLLSIFLATTWINIRMEIRARNVELSRRLLHSLISPRLMNISDVTPHGQCIVQPKETKTPGRHISLR